jgi:hypothetical protein
MSQTSGLRSACAGRWRSAFGRFRGAYCRGWRGTRPGDKQGTQGQRLCRSRDRGLVEIADTANTCAVPQHRSNQCLIAVDPPTSEASLPESQSAAFVGTHRRRRDVRRGALAKLLTARSADPNIFTSAMGAFLRTVRSVFSGILASADACVKEITELPAGCAQDHVAGGLERSSAASLLHGFPDGQCTFFMQREK